MSDQRDDAVPVTAPASPAAEPSLGRRAVRGAAVTVLGQGGRILLQMASVVVLARLLAPSEFGLLAMVLLFVGLGEIFRDFGLSSAAIQAPSVSREQRDLLFWANTAIGVVLAVVIFAGADLIALLFGQPALAPIARALSVTFIVNGMATQYRAGLNRRMQFRALAVVSVAAQAVGLVLAVVTAVAGAGYWALVAQQIAIAVASLLLFAWYGRWFPGPPRRGVPMRGFFRYGWQLMATQLIGYASNNTDNLIIGLRFGVEPLGLYNRAFQLLMNPLNQLRTPATTVALPVLSRLQDDDERFSAFVLRAQLVLAIGFGPALAVASGASVPLIQLFLGDQWLAAAPLFALLCLAAILQMLAFVGYWIYLSRGLTSQLLQYTLVAFTIKVAAIVVGSQWGLLGVAVGYLVAPALSWPLSLWWVSRYAPVSLTRLWMQAVRTLLLSALAGAASFAVARWFDGPAVVVLLAAVLAGACAVAVAAIVPAVRRDLVTVGSSMSGILGSKIGRVMNRRQGGSRR